MSVTESEERPIKRRKHWSPEQKRRIVDETNAGGVSIAGVAEKYGISTEMLYRWRSTVGAAQRDLANRTEVEKLHDRVQTLEAQMQKLLSSIAVANMSCR